MNAGVSAPKSSMTDSVGFNINTMFDRVAETIAKKGEELNTTLNGMGDEISDQDMLKMQFQLNQYNTMLEMASTVSKALTDEAKQIAQRAN
jgi:type III secretion apparatus needle protein